MRNKSVVIQSGAEADIKDAYQWYESQRKGLGENFLLCVEEALSKVSRTPQIYAIAYKDIRRALIHRFPFGIFYIEGKKNITVLAVLHARRNPQTWKERT
jgi:plasmid stabilization system protein ParE